MPKREICRGDMLALAYANSVIYRGEIASAVPTRVFGES